VGSEALIKFSDPFLRRICTGTGSDCSEFVTYKDKSSKLSARV